MALGSNKPRGGKPTTVLEEITLHPPRMGVVTFQNPADPTSGVACVAPSAIVAFNSRSELRSDVIWISNAPESVNAQNFRATGYLRSPPSQIAGDLGVTLTDVVDGLPKVAETIGRVRDIAAHVYPWMDFSNDWSHKSLAESIAKILPPHPEALAAMESPLRQAYQPYSFVPDSRFPEGTAQTIYTLRVNRLRYARYICSQMVPSADWISIPDVSQRSYRLDDFLDPAVPSLVEASVEFTTGINELITPALTAFGSSRPLGRSPIRKWISQPELAWLSQHANVHITSAFMNTGGGEPLSERYQLPAAITADPIFSLSIATGLVAESHWVALSSMHSERRAGNSATAKWVDLASPMAVWLRAADRAYCFAMAKVVAERGFSVRGYGYGGVSFYGSKNELGRIIELAEEIGTCHPCLAAVEKRMLMNADVSEV